MPSDPKGYEVLYPAGGANLSRAPAEGSLLSHALLPVSIAYAVASDLVRRVRSAGRGRTGDAVVVSVGNLEVGGNGKTPFAAHLVGELASRGARAAYVSRGFKSEAEGLGVPTVLLPLAEEPSGGTMTGVRILRRSSRGLSQAIGDEGAMVASRCPDAPLAFSKDRRRAVDAVRALFAPTHIVLDDAFQTWPVARDVDIVLLDAGHPLGNGRIVPAGSLREGVRALARADAIGFNGMETGSGGDAERLARLRDWTRKTLRREIPVFGIRRRVSFARAAPGTAELVTSAEPAAFGAGTAALSSVGRPYRFEESLERAGVTVALALRFPDHHRYREGCLRRIEKELSTRGIGGLVTTEKDWSKLREVGLPTLDVWIARLHLEIDGDDPVRICEKPRAWPAASA